MADNENTVDPEVTAASGTAALTDSTVDLDEVAAPAPTPSGQKAGWRAMIPSMSGKLAVGLVITTVIVLFAIFGTHFTLDPRASIYQRFLAPGEIDPTHGTRHLLGTTNLGRDLLAQLALGAQGSLTIGFTVGIAAMILALFFGIVSGYLGGFVDDVLSLFTNIMLVIPGLPLMIVISSYIPGRSIWLVAGVLAITSWAGSAIVLRSQARSLRNRDYVAASRIAGERTPRVILVEILPNLLPLLASQFIGAFILAVLGEAGLSFLGLGPTGAITLGTILNDAQSGQALSTGAWWWFVMPGALIAALAAGLSLINFAIDEIINPKLRLGPSYVKAINEASKEAKKQNKKVATA